jgi:hypothetical protein
VPSRRLRTQPATPRSETASVIANRKPTPCTRPCTTSLRAITRGRPSARGGTASRWSSRR